MNNTDDYNIEGRVPPEAAQSLHILFDPSYVARTDQGDKGLYRALYAISKQIGFDLKMPDELEGSFEHILHTISSLSEFRFQKVFLQEDGWWNKDNGPLLAIEKDTGNYVCLLPTAAGFYKSYTDYPITVNQDTASRFEFFAYTFFLPLPDRKVGLRDLLKLSLNPSRLELASIVFSQIILGLIGMLTPILFGTIVDFAIPLSDRSMLGQIAFGLFSASICGLILTVLQMIAFLRMNLKSTSFVQAALWERLIRLPLSFYRQFGTGELIDRIKGIDRVYQEVNANLLKTFLSLLWTFFTIIILFYYSPTVAWIALIITFFLTVLGLISQG